MIYIPYEPGQPIRESEGESSKKRRKRVNPAQTLCLTARFLSPTKAGKKEVQRSASIFHNLEEGLASTG
jgi:hypothetical protein